MLMESNSGTQIILAEKTLYLKLDKTDSVLFTQTALCKKLYSGLPINFKFKSKTKTNLN